ncbi:MULTISPECIES: hypothetical protein [unclassified Halomonas]|uniref:hypothetical protein n=1 Tax=unclassified Halomonas TaxID=2609666 RepID=UPI002076AB6C|nr:MULTISPECIES: hypothetical protein [unclassified Halomonas]
MNQEDIQELSESLMEIGSEAAYRSAISRSYYSAFHAMRSDTNTVDLAKEPSGSHAVVTAKIKARYGKALAKHFHKMKLQRNSADYDLYKRFFEKDAVKMFHDRRSLLEEVATLQADANNQGEG